MSEWVRGKGLIGDNTFNPLLLISKSKPASDSILIPFTAVFGIIIIISHFKAAFFVGVPMNTPFFVLPPPRPKLVFQKRKLADFGNNGLLIMELTPMSYFAGRELSSIILVSLNHFEENDAWAIWKHDNCLAVKGYYTGKWRIETR